MKVNIKKLNENAIVQTIGSKFAAGYDLYAVADESSKIDRISRSVLDFAGLINEFQKYGVEFISVTERFDTSTPIGKAMLMIVTVMSGHSV